MVSVTVPPSATGRPEPGLVPITKPCCTVPLEASTTAYLSPSLLSAASAWALLSPPRLGIDW